MSALRKTSVNTSPTKGASPYVAVHPISQTNKIGKGNTRQTAHKKDVNILLDLQATAPSPSSTFFQVVVQVKPERSVILREWPRKRLSQSYTHTVDPSQTKVGWEQFIKEKELNDKIVWVFVQSTVDKMKKLINEYDE